MLLTRVGPAVGRRILETAREITRQALPIKCVEAVFLATYLTQGLRELERVPVSFKSQVDGNTYKHIILAVKHNSKWGAVGLSRRRELYFKEMTFDSLGELFLEFKRSYERVFHTLKVRSTRAARNACHTRTARPCYHPLRVRVLTKYCHALCAYLLEYSCYMLSLAVHAYNCVRTYSLTYFMHAFLTYRVAAILAQALALNLTSACVWVCPWLTTLSRESPCAGAT